MTDDREKCPCTEPSCEERYHVVPRFAYENPVDLAWSARLLRTARNRRLAHERGDHRTCVSEKCEVLYEQSGRRGRFDPYVPRRSELRTDGQPDK